MTGLANPVNQRPLALKAVALLSAIRWYNILLTVFAQYLSAYTIMQHSGMSFYHMLTDYKLHAIVLASVFSIAGGFIINNFYDFEKDLINRPYATLFNRIISKRTTLNLYIAFNLIALLIALSASVKIGFFFFLFTMALWFYSHKLQKLPFIKEFAASILSVASFFAIVLHYNRFYNFIFIYGVFFMSLVYTRELIKQFMNYTGDKASNISSIPVLLGIEKATYFSMFMMVISAFCGLCILFVFGFGRGNYFLMTAVAAIVINIALLPKQQYRTINTVYKILIVLGIINILMV